MEFPQSIAEVNKKFKTIKISTLSRAKSLYLKRYFSGSFSIDLMTGGGFAYKRIIILFGARSSGKNAILNQTTAFMQRRCKNCHGILPNFYENNNEDRWTAVLKYLLQIPPCTCSAPIPKTVLYIDFEDNLSTEEPQVVKINKITSKESGLEVDGLDFNDKSVELTELKEKTDLSDEEKKRIKEIEKWVRTLSSEEQEIIQMPARDYLAACGVLVDDLFVSVPEDTEEGIDIIKPIIKQKDVDMIVWDSLQGAIPRYIKEREPGQADMGSEAKANGKLMRYVVSSYSPNNIEDENQAYKPTLFITSQVRANLTGFHAGPDSYSGGNAISHHASAIIELKRECFLKEDGTEASFKETFYGQQIRVRADKNKLAAPGDMYTLDYYFRKGENFPIGIDYIKEIVNLGIHRKIIERTGAYYKVKNESFQGMEKLTTFFRENPKFVGELYKDIRDK